MSDEANKCTVSVCKARVEKIDEYEAGGGKKSYMLRLGSPPYDPNPESENGRFFAATPSIQMSLGVLNEKAVEMFEVGKDYFVEFRSAE